MTGVINACTLYLGLEHTILMKRLVIIGIGSYGLQNRRENILTHTSEKSIFIQDVKEDNMEAFWDKEELLVEVGKNSRGEKIVVKKCEKKGKKFVDIRTFYLKDEEYFPGKGIAIPEDLVPEIIGAILK